MALSRRHHYLPIFYLKGFLNDEGTFAVFDKQHEVLKKGYFTPKTHFFEYDRNLIESFDGPTDSLEDLYSEYDSKLSRLFEAFRSNSEQVDILNPHNIQELKLFIAMMYWRLPESDMLIDKFFEGKTLDDIGIEIKNRGSNGRAPEEIDERIFNDPGFRKLSRFLVLPLNTFKIILKESDIDNWHYYYSYSDPSNLCSDSPIVFRNPSDFFDFEDDLIFPLTGHKTLVFSRRAKPEMLPPKFKVYLDLMIFRQAQRYVCGPNREYLGKIAEMYYQTDIKLDIRLAKEQLFKPFS